MFRVVCAACSHRWVAVKPNVPPHDDFECPACGQPQGEAVGPEEFCPPVR